MKQTIGIAGAGIGALTAAIALRQFGIDVALFEQTRQFGRAGADTNLTPNAVSALDVREAGVLFLTYDGGASRRRYSKLLRSGKR